VDFELPLGYPKDKPRAIAVGANVFHPNFGEYICIADFWSPAQSLVDIVFEVGEMLQWQKYNILSPLNAIAANWAASNRDSLPLSGAIELQASSALPQIKINTQGGF
jgi:ubiquitin-protein ligase